MSQRRPWKPSIMRWDHSSSFSLAVMSSDCPLTWMSEICPTQRAGDGSSATATDLPGARSGCTGAARPAEAGWGRRDPPHLSVTSRGHSRQQLPRNGRPPAPAVATWWVPWAPSPWGTPRTPQGPCRHHMVGALGSLLLGHTSHPARQAWIRVGGWWALGAHPEVPGQEKAVTRGRGRGRASLAAGQGYVPGTEHARPLQCPGPALVQSFRPGSASLSAPPPAWP